MTQLICVLAAELLLAVGVAACAQKARRGGCCGGRRQPPEKKVRVADRDPAHYPCRAELDIDGMTCGNCARRVENALNRMDGVWASVDLPQKRALLRTKQPVPDQALRSAVRQAGYTVLAVRRPPAG